MASSDREGLVKQDEEENPWRTYVDRKMLYLQDHCKVNDKLLWSLLNRKLITYHEKQEIAVKKTDLRKLNALIEIVRYKGPDSFQRFCNALDDAGQSFVATELMGGLTHVLSRPCAETGEASTHSYSGQRHAQVASNAQHAYPCSEKGNVISSPTNSTSVKNDDHLSGGLVVSKDVVSDAIPFDASNNPELSLPSSDAPPHYFNIPSEAAPFLPPTADEKWEPIHSSPSSKEIQKIAMRLGRKWSSLIPFIEPNSEELEVEARVIADRKDKLEPEKAELYLHLWKETFNDQATRYCLVKALIERGQRLTADKVFGQEMVKLVEQVGRLQGQR